MSGYHPDLMPKAPPAPPSPLFGSSMRTMPINWHAEMALLGAIFSNARAFHMVADLLKPVHFSDPVNGRIYAESARRILAGGVADPVTLNLWWQADPDYEAVGGPAYLPSITGAMVSIIGAREYAQAIVDAWKLRELISMATALVDGAYASHPDPAALIAQATRALDDTFSMVGAERGHTMLLDAAIQAIADADAAHARGGVAGLSTGMASVDDVLGGMEPGELHILGGRPGMGKTALGTKWAVSIARALREAGEGGVCMFSIEMSATALARRVLCTMSGAPIAAMKRGRHHDWYDGLVRARQELVGMPLAIEDAGSMTVGSMMLRARAARRRFGGKLSLVVVDHLHIVEPEEQDARNPTWAVGRVSKGLKEMAKNLECPVLALAQLSRAVESREDKRPTKNDLRQSGDIEQNADSIMFVYRPEYYLSKGEPEQHSSEGTDKWRGRVIEWEEQKARLAGKAELIMAKVRDGEECIVPLRFEGVRADFREAN